jgi:hypothetical protein
LNFAVMGGVILVGVIGDQIFQRRAARIAPQTTNPRRAADGAAPV